MKIDYTREFTPTETVVLSGFLRDENAARHAANPKDKDGNEVTPIDDLTIDDYAKPAFDAAVDSWMRQQVAKQADVLVKATESLKTVAEQIEVQTATAAKLAEIKGRKGEQ